MGTVGIRIYASNAVDHIMTGKAIYRAVRERLIVDAALNALLYSQALEVPLPHLTEEGGIAFFKNIDQILLFILLKASCNYISFF